MTEWIEWWRSLPVAERRARRAEGEARKAFWMRLRRRVLFGVREAPLGMFKNMITLTVRSSGVTESGFVIEVDVYNATTNTVAASGFSRWDALFVWLAHQDTSGFIVRVRVTS